jgi:hypothetical protein
MLVPGKRQHYVPRFMLRRFAIDPADKKSLVFRLDKRTGRNQRVNPVNEAVVGHYYRIVGEDGTVDNTADEVLDRIETMAAEVIAKLTSTAYGVTGDDVEGLMLFIVTLKQRTPQGREALREMDERTGELYLEMMLSDREHFHRVMSKRGDTDEEVERERLEMLEELRAGRIVGQSSPEREVGLMFMAVEHTTKTIFEQLGCICLRAPAGGKSPFIISDHPVAHYDPTPKMPEAGAGFMSSPNSVTFIPLDPTFALLLVQGQSQTWQDVDITSDEVDEMNLLTYAWAREAIYGPSQESVTRARRLAKQNPRAMAEFAYRPPRIWVTEVDDKTATPGPHAFTSRFKGREVTRTLHVSQEGIDEARKRAWPPIDARSQGT